MLGLRGSCVSKRLEKGSATDFRAIGITAGLERTFIPPSSTALCEEGSGQRDQGGVWSAGECSKHLPGGAELGFEELVGASTWAP